ncbi:MAG: hypothetical protein ABII13_03320 [Patescibacteria group bacterium]|nr:hypothetical protein [Patescibacteria group bacterium]MBU2509203.1 hypothetical protein [Patescibacteria group bacterium]
MPYSKELLNEFIKAQDKYVWEIPAWEERDRSSRWYIIMSIVAVGFVIYAVITGNFLFAFFILLAAAILVFAGHQKPHNVLVQLGQNGIVFDGRLYEYKDIENFSIIYHPPETKLLYLECGNFIRPRLRVSLEDQDPIEIRNHLKQHVDENLLLQEEHLSDILARLFKI